jgi:DNA-directed RNA polymerase beta' subunit
MARSKFKNSDIIISFQYTKEEVQEIISKFRRRRLTDDEIYDMQKNLEYIIPDAIDEALYSTIPE